MPVPKISILMPAYNAERYINQSIESVLQQTFTDWELIVVDDGSTDTTAEMVKIFVKKDVRIQYHFQQNRKQAAARNFGLTKTKGEWIAFLDADDLWEPEKLEKQLQAAQNIEADVYYTNGVMIDDAGEVLCTYPAMCGMFTGNEMFIQLYKANWIPILSVLVKKSMIIQTGLQDETLQITGAEDWDYWIRMAKSGAIFYCIEESLFLYRVNSTGTSRNIPQMKLAETLTLVKNFQKNLFSRSEVRKIFKPILTPVALTLLHSNRVKDAGVLLKEAAQKIPLFTYRINFWLYKALGKYSAFAIKMNNKIDSLLNDDFRTAIAPKESFLF